MPPFDAAARLCIAARASLEWLATGKGLREASQGAQEIAAPLDVATLGEALGIVDSSLQLVGGDGAALAPTDKARMVMNVYGLLQDSSLKHSQVVGAALKAVKSILIEAGVLPDL